MTTLPTFSWRKTWRLARQRLRHTFYFNCSLSASMVLFLVSNLQFCESPSPDLLPPASILLVLPPRFSPTSVWASLFALYFVGNLVTLFHRTLRQPMLQQRLV